MELPFYLNQNPTSKNSEANKGSINYITCHLFSIDLLNLIRTKAMLSKQFSMAPSEIDLMNYWEYEYFIQEINRLAEEENKQNEKTKESYDMNAIMKQQQAQQNKMMRNPKMPNIPSNITIKT